MNVSDVTTPYWQISTAGFGLIAQGVDDINQCIIIILVTRKGTDPFRPDFGCDIYDHLDKSVNLVIPSMIKAITEALELYEIRIKISKISYVINDAQVSFNIAWVLKDGTVGGAALLNLKSLPLSSGGVITHKLLTSSDGSIIIIDTEDSIEVQ